MERKLDDVCMQGYRKRKLESEVLELDVYRSTLSLNKAVQSAEAGLRGWSCFRLVSVVMPVFNGEQYIGRSIHAVSALLERYGIPFEIVVVDDGSRDNTRLRALEAASRYPNVRVVGYGRNRGKGAAFLYGYRHSRGDVVVLFDADLDIPPQQIPVLLAVMRRTGADIVVTNKWHPLSHTRASKLRRFLSRSYNALVRLLTGLDLRDTQTGAKAIKRRVLSTVAPKMFV